MPSKDDELSGHRINQILTAFTVSGRIKEMLDLGDVGSTVRFIGLGALAIWVGTSSLTFAWVLDHSVEMNFFPEFAGLVLYLSDIFLIGGLLTWTVGWNLSPRLNLRFGP